MFLGQIFAKDAKNELRTLFEASKSVKKQNSENHGKVPKWREKCLFLTCFIMSKTGTFHCKWHKKRHLPAKMPTLRLNVENRSRLSRRYITQMAGWSRMSDTKIKMIYSQYILCIDIKRALYEWKCLDILFSLYSTFVALPCTSQQVLKDSLPFWTKQRPACRRVWRAIFGGSLHQDLQRNVPQLAWDN